MVLQQRKVAEIELHVDPIAIIGAVQGNRKVEAAVPLSEPGIGNILPEAIDVSRSDALSVNEGQHQAIAHLDFGGVEPAADPHPVIIVDRAAQHGSGYQAALSP